MFLETSRYARVTQSTVRTRDGREVTALHLRRLPPTTGTDYVVQGNDRLDVMAQRRYADATWFWHIADANTELHASGLLQPVTRVIKVPEQ